MSILVSLIITTKNSEKHIGRCLKSIKDQTYPFENIEIIVVDNNSNDKTKEIARAYTDRVFNYGPERSVQRNFGIDKAKGEYVLYLDSDMILSEDVVSELVKKCEKKKHIALYIPERIIGKGFWIEVRNFERSFYDATCIDAVRFIRRHELLEMGGFDEGLTGPEDWDIDRRIREIGKVSIIEAAIHHNEQGFNFSRYIAKKAYYAKSFDKYIRKWGKKDRIIRKQLGFWYRYFGVFIEKGKFKKLIKHPLLAVGMYFLRISVGLAYILRKISFQFNLKWN